MNQFRNFAVWIVIGLLLFALFSLFQGQSVLRTPSNEISYSEFLKKVGDGSIKSMTYSLNSGEVVAKTADDKTLTSNVILTDDIIKYIRDKNVDMVVRAPSSDSFLSNALIYWLPMVLIIGLTIVQIVFKNLALAAMSGPA